ncbi:beta-hydroxyacyl-ACP dehydratase [Krasilnikovia sp. MM14-A1259]|uniref:beta-hydroxyacyl-ACP dehydratase n=1 Tax=Krasilnikovia sp. MM14-A1259 TaxID=3373539 RepID=UPI00382FE8C7
MIGIGELKRILPHRYPMLLVDRIVALEPGRRVTALKAVTVNEPWYRALPDDARDEDHDYPPVLLVESWCQAAAVLASGDRADPGGLPLVAQVTGVGFGAPVRPGDVLEHRARVVQLQSDALVVAGWSRVGDEVVLTVSTAIVVRRPVDALEPGSRPTRIENTVASSH